MLSRILLLSQYPGRCLEYAIPGVTLYIRFSDGRYRVYRRRGERFTDQCVYESNRFGDGSVMIWAWICHDLKIVQGTLNAVKYRDDILDPIVLSFLQQRNFDHVFQHNNARCPRIISVFFLGRHYHRICHPFMGWTR
jgi:hypothetical protein